MIRPELRAAAYRWREALAGAVVIALGLWAAFGAYGIVAWLGWGIVALGAALAVAGLQRGRFRHPEGGPGVVQVVEGRVAYFGPLTGGVADAGAITALTYDPTARPPHWVLDRDGDDPLAIPVTASGADALFDVFETLPGLRMEAVLAARQAGGDRAVVLWRLDPAPAIRAVRH